MVSYDAGHFRRRLLKLNDSDQNIPSRAGNEIELSIVIPAYLEAEALKVLLPGLKEHVAALTPSYEILVIDTEQRLDNTDEVCRTHSVTHIPRTGASYGNAVRTGLRRAAGKSILLMDADGSHNPAEIQRLWMHRDRFLIVIGSRYTSGGKTENPRTLILMSYAVNLIFRFFFSLPCRDVSNSFRLYRADAIRRVPIISNNFDLIPEVLIKICARYGPGTICEVPTTFERRKKGKSKRNLVAFAFAYVATIIRLRRLLNQYLRSEGSSPKEDIPPLREAAGVPQAPDSVSVIE